MVVDDRQSLQAAFRKRPALPPVKLLNKPAWPNSLERAGLVRFGFHGLTDGQSIDIFFISITGKLHHDHRRQT